MKAANTETAHTESPAGDTRTYVALAGAPFPPSPALVTLVDILPAVAADPRVGGDGGAAARALQRLCGGLVVLIEVRELDHQVGGHDGQGQVDLHLCLPRGQLNLLGLVPAGRPRRDGGSSEGGTA